MRMHLLSCSALVALAGCTSSLSDEPSERDEASVVAAPVFVEVTGPDGTTHLHLTQGVLPIEKVVQPRVGIHMAASGRWACGARLELPEGSVWSLGVLEEQLRAKPDLPVEHVAVGSRSALIFPSQPVAAWDSAVLLETRDGRPFADVVRSALGNVPAGKGLGTLSIELCPGVDRQPAESGRTSSQR